ncbi:MAG: amidinotransferase [Alphaproteobacteria bacterium]|nr:amidinotransferase [Alphaproteobacteria bacterium]
MSGPRRAIVRGISDRYAEATAVHYAHEGHIHLGRARAQHARYVRALQRLGMELTHIAGERDLPDCCFVEDQAVVAGDLAVITRSGHPPRRAEADAVHAALSEHLDIRRMTAPACLDGGDVLLLDRTFLVGVGARTNMKGVETLREAVAPRGYTVLPTRLPPGVLHLKSACSSPAPELIVLAEGTLDPALFTPFGELVLIPQEELYAANTLGRDGKVLLPRGYPVTWERLAAQGLEIIGLEMSEIRKGDGSLTCMSVWF